MGMVGCLLRIEKNELQEILEDSSLLENIIDKAMDEENPQLIDLDKSWEGVFYLLTGYGVENLDKAAPPLSWTLFSGQIVDAEQDLGYGPGNYVTAEQVPQVNAALQTITASDLRKRFDAKKMMKEKIYPDVWDDPETIDYILEYFESMKKFYAEAAKNSQAVITFLS